MNQTLERRAKAIFDQAIDLEGAERTKHLDAACAGEGALRERVEALLNAATKEGAFLSDPTLGGESGASGNTVGEQPGAKIGQYRLLELIGEGGFGSVFKAEQSEPVHRFVALKVVKLGMDTRAVVARFEQERQALALMDHPNIAKVFDAGATDAGRPYFVMELVAGEPITAYCDRANLSIEQRLELFTQVCRAVQHAHTKGIIHRDIKPSNVLVSEPDGADGRAMCRVIDFGIAKATERTQVEKTTFVESRQLIGTPEYMSPEQAGGAADIDTRTDVYSLGVLLYELLAGVTPFDPQRLRSAAFGEMQRIIREVDPPAPSTRVLESKATLASVAAVRRTEPGRLGSMIRGELDWIVMRALEKDRTRRYDSPGNLAADVERFLAGEPVEAAPAGAGYRLRKFVRRNRGLVVGSGVLALAIVAGAAGTGVYAWKESNARGRAEAAEKTANQRADDIARIANFQESQLKDINAAKIGEGIKADLLAEAKAEMTRAKMDTSDVEARAAQLDGLLKDVNFTNVAQKALDKGVLERSIEVVHKEFAQQPMIEARLLQTLAISLRDIGLLDKAAGPQTEALAIRRKVLGNEHVDTLVSMDESAVLMRLRGQLEEGEALFREGLGTAEPALGNDHTETMNMRNNLADLLVGRGKLAEAEPLFKGVLEQRERLLGADHKDTIASWINYAFVLHNLHRLDEGEKAARTAVERAERVLPAEDQATFQAMNMLGTILWQEKKLDDAEPFFRKAFERARRAAGDDNDATLNIQFNIGSLLKEQKKLAEAEDAYRAVLAKFRASRPAGHFQIMLALRSLALVLRDEKKFAEAAPVFREAADGYTKLSGAANDDAVACQGNLGMMLAELGRFSEGEGPLLQAVKALSDAKRENTGPHKMLVRRLADFYDLWEKAEPGKGHMEEAARWKAIRVLQEVPAKADAPSGGK